MKTLPTILASTIALGAALPAVAQSVTFDEPIRFVTPYPPGGSHSLHAGIITTAAEPHFGQSLISVIRAGGGGAVGATEVANSEPDGLTLLFGDPTINSLRPQVEDLPYGTDSFVPVARINYSPAIFVAAADGPFTTMAEMVAYAKENPGDLIYSSDNLNGWTYTVFELLKARTGTEMTGVEYGGGGPAVTRLLGGETMAYAGDISVVGEHIESGALIPLCVTDTVRIEALPDVETCPETGNDVVFQFWRGVLAPAGTPPEVVAALSDGFEGLMADEGFLRLIGRIGSSIQFADHEEFAVLLEQEIGAMADVAEIVGAGK
jgi:tripartite-type tricarboxylate transporter receptor subunit TctC